MLGIGAHSLCLLVGLSYTQSTHVINIIKCAVPDTRATIPQKCKFVRLCLEAQAHPRLALAQSTCPDLVAF